MFKASLQARSGPFHMACRANTLPYNRYGFIVSLAVSKKAASRNKLRRRMHEIIQHIPLRVSRGSDCVIRAYPGSIDLVYKEVERHILILFSKIFNGSF